MARIGIPLKGTRTSTTPASRNLLLNTDLLLSSLSETGVGSPIPGALGLLSVVVGIVERSILLSWANSQV